MLFRSQLAESWEMYVEASNAAGLEVPRNRDLTTSMMRVWAGSEFVTRACIDDPSLVTGFLDEGCLLADYAAGEYPRRLARFLEGVRDAKTLGRRLREFRGREMVRIAWRDLAGLATTMETLANLTDLAEICVDLTLEYLYQEQCQALGTPIDAEGQPMRMVVLGMGKLGGYELNFSSDIDLIFAFPE